MPTKGRKAESQGGKAKSGTGTGDGKAVFQKTCFQFKCTGEKCGRTWTSVHGWEREPEYCRCAAVGRVVNVVDEQLELDTYNCGCGENWQTFHDDGEDGVVGQQSCYKCGTLVRRETGSQLRQGRHFWFRCSNRQCGESWEDFDTNPEYFTQRCTVPTCGSRGKVVRVVQRPRQRNTAGGRGTGMGKDENGDGDGGGINGHLASHCDMCQLIISRNKGRGCMAARKVAVRISAERGIGDQDVDILK